MFKQIREWIESLNAMRAGDMEALSSPLGRRIVRTYGRAPQILRQRLTLIRRVLVSFGETYGRERPVGIVRCPGRINLMGRHVDHQGGHCNPMAIDRELVMVVQPRSDDIIRLANVDPVSFPARRFSLNELKRRLPPDDWWSFVNAQTTTDFIADNGGDWSLYVLAAILRFQNKFPQRGIQGMNLMVAGDIPIAAGLSSSSALVVAAVESVVLVNGLPVEEKEFPILCGEGEWFVGTRGGFNDHAAMKLAERERVLKVKFFDFAVEDVVDFPSDCCLAICDSGIKAKKSENTRDIYNAKVTAYAIAKALIKKESPRWADAIEHFRDIRPPNLGTSVAEIYRAILNLPLTMSRRACRNALSPNERGEIETLFASHRDPEGGYDVRGIALFGLAECERSRLCAEYLRRGDVAGLGRLMNISHDGDRVTSAAGDGKRIEFRAGESDELLSDLISRAESDDAATKETAAIHLQPGSYRCSALHVDLIVDIAKSTPGVYGAQLSGAGLGGCAMVLLDREASPGLSKNLHERYFERNAPGDSFLICTPIGGSGPLLAE
ncbi:hypothetical protein HQ563_18490 [bacterium]|nr:hypothetical protein [bacterium]